MIPYSLPSSEIIATACRVPLFAPKYKNEIWTKGPTSFCKVWAGGEESRTDSDPVFEFLDLLVQTYLEKKM